MRLAGGQSSGIECLFLASFLIVPDTTDTTYTILRIFPKNVDMTLRLTLHGLLLAFHEELGPSWES